MSGSYQDSTDPTADISIEVNGTVDDVTITSFDAVNAGQFVTPTQNFVFSWNNAIVNFTAGIPALVDPPLLAALAASNQPYM